MCGIAGFLSKTGMAPIGQTLLPMLEALGARGPDSAGVAIWNGSSGGDWIARVKLGAQAHDNADRVLNNLSGVLESEVSCEYLRVVLSGETDPGDLTRAIECIDDDIEVVSLGRQMEIVKQVGTPRELERDFAITKMSGTHGLGHTRLSTESKIDISHSQPFWAHGVPDVATVHNGHITNYHRLRRIYEGKGVRFYTENDSEIIGIYLRDRMQKGDDWKTALHNCHRDFDGSYCFLAASSHGLALVKDGFGFKPLVVAQTETWVAVATEEIVLRSALPGAYSTIEPPAEAIQFWDVPQAILA